MEGQRGRIGGEWRGVMLAATLIMVCLLAPAGGWAEKARFITVKRGDTMASLCREVYHDYTRELAALVQKANPELTDLNHLEAGQNLRFPSRFGPANPAPAPAKSAAAATPPHSGKTRAAKTKAKPLKPHPSRTAPAASRAKAAKAGDQMAQVFLQETAPPKDLLPAGTSANPGFEPGPGSPIGTVEMSQGQAWIIHSGSNLVYPVARELPLFTGDTLVTGSRAQLRCRLNDKSTFFLAGHTKLFLDKSAYDPEKDRRESVLEIAFGRARFIVNPLDGGYDNDYQVRTPTAFCGVRGSDFAVAVAPVAAGAANLLDWRATLAELISVRSAHAAPRLALTTTILAGPHTTVGFGGLTGSPQVVTAGTISAATMGEAATAPLVVSPPVVDDALNGVGSLSAVMAMPPSLE